MMTEHYELWMPGPPPTVTAQTAAWRVVHGKPMQYKTAKLKAAEAELDSKLVRPYQEPLDAPLRVAVEWLYPAGNHRTGPEGWTWKTTRPDADNLLKLLLDRMTKRGFWVDDNLIASVTCEKRWVAENPGIRIRIETMQEQAT